MKLFSVISFTCLLPSSLLFQLITFKPHGKVKLSEEVTTKLSGHIVVRLLSQCNLGVSWLLCPLFDLSVFLGSLLLLFVTAVMIIIEIRAFLVIIT